MYTHAGVCHCGSGARETYVFYVHNATRVPKIHLYCQSYHTTGYHWSVYYHTLYDSPNILLVTLIDKVCEETQRTHMEGHHRRYHILQHTQRE